MNWDTIFPVILGAVLAILTTFVTSIFTNLQENRTRRTFLIRFLKAEIPSCILHIDALLRVYHQSHKIEPSLVNSLERSNNLFKSYRESIYFLSPDIGLEVLKFYDSVGHSIDMILSMLRLIHNSDYKDYALEEIKTQMSQLGDSLIIGKSLILQLNKRSGYVFGLRKSQDK